MVDTRQFGGDDDRGLSTDGSLQPNAVLQNRYRVEGILGVGGMGSVYRARDLQFPEAKRYVAVKEMLHQSTDPQLRELALRNFRREANILAGLSHPAIPTIHDYFATKERAYLVMEYIEGDDLDNVMTRHEGFLPVAQIVEWGVALCDVLSYLHNSEPPIIFRDIKPSNLMIDSHNRLRLIDFGIAKHFEPETKGTMIGTEGYAAPESYRGQATPSSDVFGVGATLHHLLTLLDPRLEAPFTFAERPIRNANPEVPVELENLVMKALAFGPDDRYQTAEAMRDALSRLIGGGRLMVSGLAGVADDARPVEDWQGVDQGGIGIEPHWVFKVEEEIRSTPAVANDLVYITAYDNNLYAVKAETGELKWKFPAEDVIASSPAVSEEEGMVLFGSRDYSLYAVDMRSGRIRWSFQTQAPIYSSPAIDHGHVFFGSDDGMLYALRLGTGRIAWKHDVQEAIRNKPAVTNDRVMFGSKNGEFTCVDLSGQIKWRFKARRDILSSPVVGDGLVYFGSNDGHIYAIEVDNGWAVWKVQTNKPVVSSPLYAMDRVYVGSVNGKMYSFDASNGRERWSFDTENQITSSPAYLDGAIYFGANNNKIYCIDAKSGQERWAYTTGGIVPGSPTAGDGSVFVGSTDQKLYAFKA